MYTYREDDCDPSQKIFSQNLTSTPFVWYNIHRTDAERVAEKLCHTPLIECADLLQKGHIMETLDLFEHFAEFNDIDVYAFKAYCQNHHITEEQLEEDGHSIFLDFTNSYQGDFHSEADFARDWAEEQGDTMSIPDYLLDCIDWQEVWDATLRHDFWSQDGYIFHNI